MLVKERGKVMLMLLLLRNSLVLVPCLSMRFLYAMSPNHEDQVQSDLRRTYTRRSIAESPDPGYDIHLSPSSILNKIDRDDGDPSEMSFVSVKQCAAENTQASRRHK